MIGRISTFFFFSTIRGDRIIRHLSLCILIVLADTTIGDFVIIGLGFLYFTFFITSSNSYNYSSNLIRLYKLETSFIGGESGYYVINLFLIYIYIY